MKITFIIHSLGGGGAERVAMLLAQGLIDRQHQVSFITLFSREFDFYQLPENIPRIALKVEGSSANLLEAAKNNSNRLRLLRQAIDSSKPEAIISFLEKTNVLVLLACIGKKYPLIVTEHNDPIQNNISPIWSLLRRLVYPLADKVVSVSQGVDRHWNWLDPRQRAVIYNPLAVKEVEKAQKLPAFLDPERKKVVAMGRLTSQKGFDLLLKAFAKVQAQFPDWQLVILGEGEKRQELEDLARQLEIEEKVAMPGLVNNPFPILKQCDLFVLASRYEGFGNVIIEAMACGLPVISTDCPSGPSEIIANGDNGILVPNQNQDELASAMVSLMSDPPQRQALATRAFDSLDRFKLEVIIEQWEQLLMS